MLHKLHVARLACGYSVERLAELANISASAIYRIEGGHSPHKTHVGVAEALAEALNVEVSALFDPLLDLTEQGRPPHTGKSCQKSVASKVHEVMCPNCFVMTPTHVECDTCGWSAAA